MQVLGNKLQKLRSILLYIFSKILLVHEIYLRAKICQNVSSKHVFGKGKPVQVHVVQKPLVLLAIVTSYI